MQVSTLLRCNAPAWQPVDGHERVLLRVSKRPGRTKWSRQVTATQRSVVDYSDDCSGSGGVVATASTAHLGVTLLRLVAAVGAVGREAACLGPA